MSPVTRLNLITLGREICFSAGVLFLAVALAGAAVLLFP